jgi:acyl-CoA hydrolase
VTVSVEGVEFKSPVEVGDLVEIKASVNYVGRTTMIVGMRVESFNPRDGIVRHTNSCYFTMAAKDEQGNLTEVPGLKLTTETQIRRFCEGKIIRKLSQEKREILKSDLGLADMKIQCAEERCSIEI